MCFASGSIFGNKFLTPEGIKTLFPIFENSLCCKELAVETQHLKRTKTNGHLFYVQKFLKQFQNIWKGSHLNICLWQYSGLMGYSVYLLNGVHLKRGCENVTSVVR